MAREAQSTVDTLLTMKDAGLVAADAAATVSSVAKIIDTGGGVVTGDIIVDISAIETASTDETYGIILEGSDSSDFSTGTPLITPLAMLWVGAGAAASYPGAGTTTSVVGRYILPFRNEQNGHVFRYLRIYTDVTGTIATGINYTAQMAKSRI